MYVKWLTSSPLKPPLLSTPLAAFTSHKFTNLLTSLRYTRHFTPLSSHRDRGYRPLILPSFPARQFLSFSPVRMLRARTMVSAIAPPSTTGSPYRLANLANLQIGHTVVPSWTHQGGIFSMDNISSPSHKPHLNGFPSSFFPASLSDAIQTPPGIYNVQQLVASCTPLLNVVISRLGQDPPGEPPARSVLVDGLAASLATRGRESTLPLNYSAKDTARSEIVHQANRIAETIVKNVKKSMSTSVTKSDIRLRSPCEGHLWTPAVASLLVGPRSDSYLMELYNEWLHRMILLRDSLIPFENYEDVPLVIPQGSNRGIRDLEEPRKFFLVHCLTGVIQQMAIVDLAKVFTARHLPRGGYGFQYSQGLILPAFLSGSRSLHLLRYHPAHFYESESEILFDYEHKEYINAPRTELSGSEAVVSRGRWNLASLLDVDTRVTESSLAVDAGGDALRRIVKLRLTLDSGICVSVDLGQIARGRRYAYEIKSAKNVNSNLSSSSLGHQSAPESTVLGSSITNDAPTAFIHSTTDILSKPGLVISPRIKAGHGNTIHVIPTTDPILKLALLGKLYPENVILLKEQDNIDALGNAGKGFAERLVIFEKDAGKV